MTANVAGIRAGRAYVEITADDRKALAVMHMFQAKLQKWGRQISALGAAWGKSSLAVLAPATALVKLWASAGDEIHKMSIRTGIGAETLSTLGYAARRSGSDLQTLDQALKDLAKFSTEAAAGSKLQIDTLRELGITAEQIDLVAPERQLLLLADALKGIEDPQKRAALAMRVFGENGRKLLPLLEEGAEGIRKLQEQAKARGNIFTDADAKAAAEMNDAIDDVWEGFKALGSEIARALLPVAKEFAAWLIGVLPTLREWVQTLAPLLQFIAKMAISYGAWALAALAVGKSLQLVGGMIDFVRKRLILLGKGIEWILRLSPMMSAALLAAAAATAFIGLVKWIYQSTSAVKALNRELARAAELNEKIKDRQQKNRDTVVGQVIKGELDSGEAVKQAQNDLEGLKARIEDQKKLVMDIFAKQKNSPTFQIELENLKQYNAQLEAQKDHVQELIKLDAQRQRNRGRTDDELEGIGKILAGLKDQVETLGMDSAQKTIRELGKLNADEKELGEARKRLAEISAKQAALDKAEAARKEAEDREKDIDKFFADLEEQFDTIGLDEQSLAFRALAKLTQDEELLADARMKLIQISEKQAALDEQRAADEKRRANQQSIGDTLKGLRDEIADLRFPPEFREQARMLREFAELEANPQQMEELRRLLAQRQKLEQTQQQAPTFSAQAGTFSSLASRMFVGDEKQVQKSIKNATEETARNTAEIKRNRFRWGQ